eukprot:365610-Chlamydomonas_euryale.AAC.5
MQMHAPSKGLHMKGRAESLQVLGSYRVLLAPLRFGAGIKGKVSPVGGHAACSELCGCRELCVGAYAGWLAMQGAHAGWWWGGILQAFPAAKRLLSLQKALQKFLQSVGRLHTLVPVTYPDDVTGLKSQGPHGSEVSRTSQGLGFRVKDLMVETNRVCACCLAPGARCLATRHTGGYDAHRCGGHSREPAAADSADAGCGIITDLHAL